jgi:hypothetical protein
LVRKVAGAGKFAISERVREVVPEWPIGETVVCPECGKPGKASITTAKGAREKYVYRVVYHSASERCIVKGAVAKITETGEIVRVEGGRGRRTQRRAGKAAAPVTAFAEEVPAQAQAQPPARVQAQVQVQIPAEEGRVEVAKPVEVPGLRSLEAVRKAVDNYGWYAFLVGLSWGAVRATVEKVPPEEAVSHFRSQARKLIGRLGITAEEAVAAVEAYAKEPNEVTRRVASERAANLAKQVCWILADAVAAAVQKQVAPQPALDAKALAEAVAEEVRRQVEEAVKRAEEVVAAPVVVVSKREYEVAHAVYRGKTTKDKREVAEKYGIPYEKMGEEAKKVWDRVFAPGKKVVVVEG